MKCATIITMLLPALLAAQPFEFVQELDSIPVVVDGDTLQAPWLGGYAMTSPDLCDIDGDGDYDLLLGAAIGSAFAGGKLAFWQNQGTISQSKFQLVDPIFQGIDSTMDPHPEFWDMDADGDLDLFDAHWFDPRITVYRNDGSASNPLLVFVTDTLRDTDGNRIYCQRAALVDLDLDGDKDLICGEWNGALFFYTNVGNSLTYAFQLMSSQFEGIDVGTSASPVFCDIDADRDLDLFIGTSGGKIFYYRNDGTPPQYNFVLVSNQWMNINVAEKAVPEIVDIDADGDYDLFIGKDNDETHTVPGSLHYWRNDGTPQIPQMMQESQMYLTLDFEDGTEPGIMDVNFDDKGDLFVHAFYISWLKDVGIPQNPVFELQSYNVAGTGFLASGTGFGDLNGDSYQDMVVVYGWSGSVGFWFNNGDTTNPQFYYDSGFSIGQLAGGPELADMDGDGDNDLIVDVSSMQFDPYIYYYENQGDPQRFNFVLATTNYQGWADYYDIYAVVDFDGDGDFDVIAEVDSTNTMIYLENVGSPQNASFASGYPNFIPVDPFDFKTCDFCDVDNDGDMDAFFGSILGGIKFYRNVTGENGLPPGRQTTAPYRGPVLSIGPNPANPLTVISCQLLVPSNISLEIFDISGKKVIELASGLHLPGEYRYVWDASKNASGMYVIRLQTPQFNTSQKLTIVK